MEFSHPPSQNKLNNHQLMRNKRALFETQTITPRLDLAKLKFIAPKLIKTAKSGAGDL